MGTKFSRRLVVFLLAFVMVFASGAVAFAQTSSPDKGTKAPTCTNLGTSESFLNHTIRFKWKATNQAYSKAFMRVKGGTWKSVKTNNQYYEWKGLKEGTCYQFKAEAWNAKGTLKASSTISYRWMQSAKASATGAKGSFTVKWNKVSGATLYQIEYSKSKSMTSPQYAYAKGSATSVKITAAKGTWYYRIRPVQGSYIGIYNGIQSVTVK